MAFMMSKRGWITIAVLVAGALIIGAFAVGLVPMSLFKFGPKPDVTATINNWIGYRGILFENGGLEPNDTCLFYKNHHIRVKFVWQDNFDAAHNAWKGGAVDGLWQTLDAFTTEVTNLMPLQPEFHFIVDKSRGGDLCVARPGINRVEDLRGKKIACTLQAPSHTLLLRMLQTAGMKPTDVEIIGTADAIAAKQAFINGNADAAVIWSPDDQDCLNEVKGSKVIWSTKLSGEVINDIIVFQGPFVSKHPKVIEAFVAGCLEGNAIVNSSSSAQKVANEIFRTAFNNDPTFVENVANNARLCTYGDNVNALLNASYKGMTAERLYRESGQLFFQAGYAPENLPDFKQIANTKILRSITGLTGSANAAEGGVVFAKATEKVINAPEVATKKVIVNFAVNSDKLDEIALATIEREFTPIARANPGFYVRIEGNTDNTGSDVINEPLSYRRALSVANYLSKEYGYSDKRWIVVGHGSRNPLPGNTNSTTDERQANRRTEFKLVPPTQ